MKARGASMQLSPTVLHVDGLPILHCATCIEEAGMWRPAVTVQRGDALCVEHARGPAWRGGVKR